MKIIALLTVLATASAAFTTPQPATGTSFVKKSSLASTFTPEDFQDPNVSLFDKLNGAKKKGEPLIENILEPSYAVMLATAMAGPVIYGLYGGEVSNVSSVFTTILAMTSPHPLSTIFYYH